jgi:hypothetical protein
VFGGFFTIRWIWVSAAESNFDRLNSILSVIIEIGIIGFDPNRFIADGFVVLTKSTMSQVSVARLPSHGTKVPTPVAFPILALLLSPAPGCQKARGFIYVDIGNHQSFIPVGLVTQ